MEKGEKAPGPKGPGSKGQVDGMNPTCCIHLDMCTDIELSKVIDGNPLACSQIQAAGKKNKSLNSILSMAM